MENTTNTSAALWGLTGLPCVMSHPILSTLLGIRFMIPISQMKKRPAHPLQLSDSESLSLFEHHLS